MAVRVEQCAHRDPGDVLIGRGRVESSPGPWRRQHPEMGRHRQHLEIVVREESGINRDVGGVRSN